MLSPTNLLLACQGPKIRCSFCRLGSSSAIKTTIPGHAPGLSRCGHRPLHREHVRGTAHPGLLYAVSRMGILGGGEL